MPAKPSRLEKLTELLQQNAPASEEALKVLRNVVGSKVPKDYLEYLRLSNGSSMGPVGDSDLQISLLPVEDIAPSTEGYDFPESVWHIGGDGFGTALLLDMRGDKPLFA